jgi:hypothetical protein
VSPRRRGIPGGGCTSLSIVDTPAGAAIDGPAGGGHHGAMPEKVGLMAAA